MNLRRKNIGHEVRGMVTAILRIVRTEKNDSCIIITPIRPQGYYYSGRIMKNPDFLYCHTVFYIINMYVCALILNMKISGILRKIKHPAPDCIGFK